MSARIDAMEFISIRGQLMNAGEMPVAEISRVKFFCSTNLETASEAMQILAAQAICAGMRWNVSIAKLRLWPLVAARRKSCVI